MHIIRALRIYTAAITFYLCVPTTSVAAVGEVGNDTFLIGLRFCNRFWRLYPPRWRFSRIAVAVAYGRKNPIA